MSNNPEKKTKKSRPVGRVYSMDYTLLFLVIFFVGLGFVMLYSTTAYGATLKKGDGTYYLKRQAIFALIGFIAVFLISRWDYKAVLKPFSVPIYFAATMACIMVNFLGHASHGQSRWYSIGGFTIQPSEFAKIAIIIFVASTIDSAPKKLREFKYVIFVMAISGPLLLSVAINNASTAVIMTGILVVMVFVCNPDYLKFLSIAGGLLVMGAAVLYFASYRMRRVQAWLHPETVDSDLLLQTRQAMYAIGSGGLFGKGLGESVQKNMVPEASNDMIFSIICEELGIFGAVCIILMYILLLYRLIYIANHARDLMGSYIAIGVMTHIAIQVFMNIAVVTNTMPNTGVMLPFISYGGSGMIATLIEIGMVLSVSRRANLDD